MTAQMAPLVFVMAEMIRPQQDHRLIFTYDLMMDEAAIQRHCPRARFISTARVLNRQFIVNAEGAVTSVRRDGYAIYGVVWESTEAESIHFERFLGVPRTVDRLGAFARTRRGSLIAVEFYGSSNHRYGEADPDDIVRLMGLAKFRDFPEAYQEELASWAPGPVEPDSRPRLVRLDGLGPQ